MNQGLARGPLSAGDGAAAVQGRRQACQAPRCRYEQGCSACWCMLWSGGRCGAPRVAAGQLSAGVQS